ncbi:MAG TPA: hypothetical protein VMR73_00930 [Candidatus Paceibacterota bacterium]|nr:hypothetical protein [Candidatus Paceibacterota bacterium]
MLINVVPSAPAPNSTVYLQAQSSSFDIDSAYITWTVNGQVFAQGTGDKNISVPTGPLGSPMQITVNATTQNSGVFSASTAINPSSIGLIWEADTYTPPFYQGKTMRAWGASYKVVAVPEVALNGVLAKPDSLVYKWSKNNSVDGDVSGYGKYVYQGDNSISYTRGGDDISVTVSTSDGTVVGESSITVPVTQAAILIYEDNPLYGVLYNQALDTETLSGDSISLRAEPFFFSLPTVATQSLVWTLNGNAVPDFDGSPSITFARQNKTAGQAVVEASLQSPFALLQGAQKSVTINIDAEP